MMLSKKEISILIEIIFAISFAFIFMPYFYENNDNSLVLMDGLIRIVIEFLEVLSETDAIFEHLLAVELAIVLTHVSVFEALARRDLLQEMEQDGQQLVVEHELPSLTRQEL